MESGLTTGFREAKRNRMWQQSADTWLPTACVPTQETGRQGLELGSARAAEMPRKERQKTRKKRLGPDGRSSVFPLPFHPGGSNRR